MDKQQLLNLIDSLDLPKSEYYVLSSGSLVLFGLREKANDLDICVSEPLFNTLKEKYHLTDEKKTPDGTYIILKNVEIIVDFSFGFNFDFTYKDGYPVQKLRSILNAKLKRNLPKDQEDIAKLKGYFEKLKFN